jgi:hypothetical protein
LKEQKSEDVCGEESLLEVCKIIGENVKQADCKMKSGKGDVSGGYSSDEILNAPDIFFDQLAMVYRSWLLHGTVSLNLLSFHCSRIF